MYFVTNSKQKTHELEKQVYGKGNDLGPHYKQAPCFHQILTGSKVIQELRSSKCKVKCEFSCTCWNFLQR